jgi:GxxExxY protein
MNMDALTDTVIGCAIRVHRALGSGMLESAYEAALAHALSKAGLAVERQILVPIHFEGELIDGGFRADIIVERRLLIELKSVERLAPVHAKQVQTYLRFLDLRVGLLMNFAAPTLREGLKRIVSDYRPEGTSALAINTDTPRPPCSPRETS